MLFDYLGMRLVIGIFVFVFFLVGISFYDGIFGRLEKCFECYIGGSYGCELSCFEMGFEESVVVRV